ncbi:MAG: hypothetical protein ACRCZB_08080 [Bacteroidales bacterium]
MKNGTIEYSFLRGWGLLKAKDQEKVKAAIMVRLNIETRNAWCKRRRGDIEPKVSEAKAIEAIFAKYGVSKENVWGV